MWKLVLFHLVENFMLCLHIGAILTGNAICGEIKLIGLSVGHSIPACSQPLAANIHLQNIKLLSITATGSTCFIGNGGSQADGARWRHSLRERYLVRALAGKKLCFPTNFVCTHARRQVSATGWPSVQVRQVRHGPLVQRPASVT